MLRDANARTLQDIIQALARRGDHLADRSGKLLLHHCRFEPPLHLLPLERSAVNLRGGTQRIALRVRPCACLLTFRKANESLPLQSHEDRYDRDGRYALLPEKRTLALRAIFDVTDDRFTA